jgi:hypothetical protein
MTNQAEKELGSVAQKRDLDEELSWWGNTPWMYWSLKGPSGAESPMDWLNGATTGPAVEVFRKWWREIVGERDVESHPLVWLPEWKREFMVGREGIDGEREVPGAYPAVEKLHCLGVAVRPLLSEITDLRLRRGYVRQIRAAIRSRKEREKDAEILDEAARLVAKWEPVLSQYTPMINITIPGRDKWWQQKKAYPDSQALKWVAGILRDIGSGQRHRASDIDLLKCALKLRDLITAQIGTPRVGEIGQLLQAAFPEDFYPEKDLADATNKLLKRAEKLAGANRGDH